MRTAIHANKNSSDTKHLGRCYFVHFAQHDNHAGLTTKTSFIEETRRIQEGVGSHLFTLYKFPGKFCALHKQTNKKRHRCVFPSACEDIIKRYFGNSTLGS